MLDSVQETASLLVATLASAEVLASGIQEVRQVLGTRQEVLVLETVQADQVHQQA
jgi:hypothetical protein